MTPPAASRHTELRHFGLLMAALLIAVFGLLLPWLFGRAWPTWPWILGALFALPALLRPALLAPVERGWLCFGHAMGRINTMLLLGLAYFLLITPLAFLLRLFGHDALRRPGASPDTFRRGSRQREANHMEKPF
jgi:hypothetical protein